MVNYVKKLKNKITVSQFEMSCFAYQQKLYMKSEKGESRSIDMRASLLTINSEITQSSQTICFSNKNIELPYYDYQGKGSNLNPRLLLRQSKHSHSYHNLNEQRAINITFLYLQYLKENRGMKKFLLMNVILDILIRASILMLFCLSDSLESLILIIFISCIQIPRVLHLFTTIKLLFMDQYQLKNRSFLPISHLYRVNFIEERETDEKDLKPLNYKNSIISCRAFLFVLLPVEFCFLMIPRKNYSNITNTIIISSYILKSMEVIIFEPALLYVLSKQIGSKNFEHGNLIFILVLVDIVKYALLNIYLVIFSETGQKNTIKL